ncbi:MULTISPECIES: hypothetical protein [Paraburkholderia]|jgi:hypothetical protein|uniref:Uncharacterized protein n=1 Tax=Paraburkholderia phenazinium TaxID=60549 RepID=A0A1N6JXW4_9BURK|nr:hypothetical protein [Paraburkholderia phenazinium]SIO49093.1 hypothetical protein SAMN05444168_5381 [Paraburkholderia phenazinium]
MKLKTIAPLAVLLLSTAAWAADGGDACGRLVGASGANQPDGGFRLRSGEPVDFVGGGKTVHGALQVFVDGSVYRAYWQPDGGHELYVLANAAANSTRLISTPPQGQPAGAGQPGTVLAPLNVVSCPAL